MAHNGILTPNYRTLSLKNNSYAIKHLHFYLNHNEPFKRWSLNREQGKKPTTESSCGRSYPSWINFKLKCKLLLPLVSFTLSHHRMQLASSLPNHKFTFFDSFHPVYDVDLCFTFYTLCGCGAETSKMWKKLIPSALTDSLRLLTLQSLPF